MRNMSILGGSSPVRSSMHTHSTSDSISDLSSLNVSYSFRSLISSMLSLHALDLVPVHLNCHLRYSLIAVSWGRVALDNTPIVMKETSTHNAKAPGHEVRWYEVLTPILGDSLSALHDLFWDKETTVLLLLDTGTELRSWCDLLTEQRCGMCLILQLSCLILHLFTLIGLIS